MDHISVTNQNNIIKVCIHQRLQTFPLNELKQGTEIPVAASKAITYHCFRNFVELYVLAYLCNPPFKKVDNNTNSEEVFAQCNNQLLAIYTKCAPLCTKCVKYFRVA